MKRILITGVNSYVGNSFAEWVSDSPESYSVTKISLRDETWKEQDFSEFDVVLHVAGIAHKKETKKNADLYYKVNRDLTFEIAKKAKAEGVKQFIFLSSMSVYGMNKGTIHKYTPVKPKSNYGKSKWEAEKNIETLNNDNFKIAIIRPPMIYGKGCKGNYQRLRKIALKTPVFPDISNKRSMIFIDNLSEFIKYVTDNIGESIYFHQNIEYVNTSNLVKNIAKVHEKRILLTKLFNPLLKKLNESVFNKVFGDLIYENIDHKDICFLSDFKQTIFLTEKRD